MLPCHFLFIHQLVDIRFFYFLAVTNNAAMNLVSFCVDIYFFPLGYISRSGITRPCSKSVFDFLRNCQTVFQRGYMTSPAVYKRFDTSIFLPTLVTYFFLTIRNCWKKLNMKETHRRIYHILEFSNTVLKAKIIIIITIFKKF